MTFIEFLRVLLCAVIGYLIGCFSTGDFLAKHQDVNLRGMGSGSVGATNVFRIMGAKPALLTLVGDILKGAVAAGIGMIIASRTGAFVGGIAVASGHIWPLFAGFKGGKGVTTAMGAVLIIQPVLALALMAAWAVMTALLHMTSAPSLTAAVVYVGVNLIFYRSDPGQIVFTIVLACMLIFSHRENIVRIIKGKENKLDFRARHSRQNGGSKRVK